MLFSKAKYSFTFQSVVDYNQQRIHLKMIKIVFLICLALSTIEAEQFITFKDTKEDPCGTDPFYIACSEVNYIFYTFPSSQRSLQTK